MSSGLELLLDDNRGQWIPLHFAEEFRHELFDGYSMKDVETLLTTGRRMQEGKDEPDDSQIYWEVWTKILDNAVHVDDLGYEWRLYQDGAVWLYCEELMSEQEEQDFFGEEI